MTASKPVRAPVPNTVLPADPEHDAAIERGELFTIKLAEKYKAVNHERIYVAIETGTLPAFAAKSVKHKHVRHRWLIRKEDMDNWTPDAKPSTKASESSIKRGKLIYQRRQAERAILAAAVPPNPKRDWSYQRYHFLLPASLGCTGE